MEKIVIGLSVDTDEAIKNVNKFSGELGKLKKELEQEKAELSQIRKEFKALNTPVDQLTASQKKLREELQKQGKTLDDVSKAYASQQGKVKALNQNYRDAENSVTGLSKGTGRLKGAITDGLKSFTLLAGGIGAVIGVATQLVNAFIDLNSQLNETSNRAQFFFDVTEEQGRALATQATIIGKQFDQDVNSVLDTANSLSKEFGVSGEEALNLLSEGLAKGGRFSEDFLHQLREYPSQLSQIGLDADETIAILNQTTKEGIYSDKGLDALKEAGIRLRENTNATQEALDAVGLGDIPARIQEGSITTFEAIQEISGKLKELGNTGAETGTLIADVFGGAGEDAGFRFLSQLEGIDTNLSNVESTLSATETAQNRLTEVWTNFLSTGSSGDAFFSGVIDVVSDLIEALEYNADLIFDELTPAFDAIVDAVGEIIRPFKQAIEQLGLFNSEGESTFTFLNLLKSSIELTSTPFQALARSITLVLRAFTFATVKIREGIANLVEDVPFLGDLIGDAVRPSAEVIAQAEANLGEALDSFLALPAEKIQSFKDIFSGAKKDIEEFSGDLGVASGGKSNSNGGGSSQADKNAEAEKKQQEAIEKTILALVKKTDTARIALEQEKELAEVAQRLREEGASQEEINAELQRTRAEQAKENKLRQLEEERAIALENEALTQEQKDIINQEFRDQRLIAEQNYQQTLTEIQLTEEEKRLQAQEKAQKESDKLQEQSLKKKEAIISDVTGNLSGAVEGFLTGQENALEGFASGVGKIALDALDKQAPALIAGIFGQGIANLGFPAGLIASAGATAIFKGLIATAKASFEEGGQLPKYATGGLLQGRSHREGGIPLFRNGAQIAEVEGGEFVVNKNATAQNLRLLEAINAGEFSPNSPTVSSAQNSANATYESIKSNREKEPLTAIVSEQDVTRSQKRISKFERTSTLR